MVAATDTATTPVPDFTAASVIMAAPIAARTATMTNGAIGFPVAAPDTATATNSMLSCCLPPPENNKRQQQSRGEWDKGGGATSDH